MENILATLEEYHVDQEIGIPFIDSLETHIAYVKEAGKQLGVPNGQLDIHDQSKWSIDEFGPYARHFFGDGDPIGFPRAWLHHLHSNPHHWQYWTFPYDYHPKNSYIENRMIEMPREYALEMVADWMGASRAYSGSWDMTTWLQDNHSKVSVHSKTAVYLQEILTSLGYGEILSAWTISNHITGNTYN
jgi:hypothetical protein